MATITMEQLDTIMAALEGALNAMINLEAFVTEARALGFGDEDADISGADAVDLINRHWAALTLERSA